MVNKEIPINKYWKQIKHTSKLAGMMFNKFILLTVNFRLPGGRGTALHFSSLSVWDTNFRFSALRFF